MAINFTWEDLTSKLLGMPKGSPSPERALGIIGRDTVKDIGNSFSDLFTGGHKLDRPIELDYGTAIKSNDFADIMSFRDRMNAQNMYPSPGNKQGSTKTFQEIKPEVQGVVADYEAGPQMDLQGNQQVEIPYSTKVLSVPQIQGRQPIKDIVPDEGTIQRYVNNAKKWAGTVSADPRLTFRQKDTVAENAEYVGQYLEAVMRLAPYFDLPPKTMAAMLMEESGWGGQRFEGNLGGYGFLDSGEDMGIRFNAPSIEEQAAKYLEKVASDWDGRYQGSRTPEDFHKKGYNPHAEYPGRVRSIMSMLERE